MAKTDQEIEADWRIAMAGPGGPKDLILGPARDVESYFHQNSNLTRSEMKGLWVDRRNAKGWGERVWRKLEEDGNCGSVVDLARLLAIGQRMQWIAYNPSNQEFSMTDDFDNLNGLMWQIALSNWDATKKSLTLSHLNTMVRFGLRNLHCAVLPHEAGMTLNGPPNAYRPDDVDSALSRLTVLVKELNGRMRQAQRPALPEAKESQDAG